MIFRNTVKLSLTALLALAATTSYAIRKLNGKFGSKFNPQTVVIDSYGYGGFDFKPYKPAPRLARRKKIIQRYNIVVPNLEGSFECYPFTRSFYQNGHKTAGFGNVKKLMEQYEDRYHQDGLKELKKNGSRKFTFAERCAGTPEAQKKFEQLFKKKCGKSIQEATDQDLKLMIKILKNNESLKKCTQEFIELLKTKKYHCRFKECVEGNEKGCKQVKKYIRDAGINLYWNNYDINTIAMSALLAGHPKNFKNEEL